MRNVARVTRDRRADVCPVLEPDLDQLAGQYSARLSYTAEAVDLRACDIVYIAPDMPTDDRGRSDLSAIPP